MSKQIDYTATIDATAQNAKDTIDTLASERSAGNITDYSVEYRADVGAVEVHVWLDVATTDELPAGFDSVDTALSNCPVTLPDAPLNAPVHNR